MKKTIITLAAGLLLISSCNKIRDGYEKKGVSLSYKVIYNQDSNITSSSVKIYEYGVWYSGYSEYYGIQDSLVNNHNININGTQYTNTASSYKKTDIGLISQTTFVYRENSNTYINSFAMIDTIAFSPIDTLHVLTDDSVFFVGNLNQDEEVTLSLRADNYPVIGKTNTINSKGIRIDRRVTDNYLNQTVTVRFTRTKKIEKTNLNLPNNQGVAYIESYKTKQIYITY